MLDPDRDRLGFVRNSLLRHSAEREHEVLARHADHPAAVSVVIAGELAILAVVGEAATSLLPLGALDQAGPIREQAFLGTLDDRPVLASLVEAEAAERFREDAGFRVLDLRSIAVQGVVPADELGILAEAKALLFWHARHRFCSSCGAPTRVTAAGFRRDCAACATQHFPRTDPVAIMLAIRGDFCLLGRQARFLPNVYSCLAGFIEPGETIEDAVRRETFEEAGLRLGKVRYLASQPWPFPASLMIGCLGEALGEELSLDRDELEDARWFSRDEARRMLERSHAAGLLTPPPMAIANFLIRSFVAGEAP